MYEPGEMDEKSLEAIAISYRMEEIGLISIVRDGNAASFDWEEEEAGSKEGTERARKRAFIEKDLTSQERELKIEWRE